MKFLMTFVAFGASAGLCVCGGGWKGAKPVPGSHDVRPHMAENWEFTTMPFVTGRAPMTLAGGITQAGTAVSSALHVNGTRCFSGLTTVSLTGGFDQDTLSLTSAAIDGQVVTLTGTFDDAGFLGTYKVKGGCANGSEGIVVGTATASTGPSIANQLSEAFIDTAMRL